MNAETSEEQRLIIVQYGYQILLNGSRLGFYDPIRKTINSTLGVDPEKGNAVTALASGALTGCIGGELLRHLHCGS